MPATLAPSSRVEPSASTLGPIPEILRADALFNRAYAGEIATEEHYWSVFHSTPPHPQAWRLHKCVSRIVMPMKGIMADDMRAMTPDEELELADVLSIPAERLRKKLKCPFQVVIANCPSCERLISIVDFAVSALERNLHSGEMIAQILSGEVGPWLLVGTGLQSVPCRRCKTFVPFRPGLGYCHSMYGHKS